MVEKQLNDEEKQKIKTLVEQHMKSLGIELCCDHVSNFDPPV